MRSLADYVLRTRTDEVPVSPPLPGDSPRRITMGFSAHDANLVRHLAGQEAVLVRNIERPGEAIARLKVIAVEPAASQLIAEVVGAPPPQPVRPKRDPRASSPESQPARRFLLTAAVVLPLIVLAAAVLALRAHADRSCTSSMDCPEGFACAAWGNPAPGEAEYRSCERECLGDRDCPGSAVCVYVGVGVKVCRADR